MSFIGSMLGAGQGSDYQAAGNPIIATQSPVSQEQINGAYVGSQNSLQAQNALLQALQGQNGINNQNQVYGQLQGVANGSGPNPAQAQYQQNVNQLAAQQAGLLGSQKGISPALQARLIAQQGSSAMQNAAGQGAANLANQQLGAMTAAGQMANTQAGNQIGQTNANVGAQQGEQQNLLGAQAAYGNQQAGILGNMNQTNSATQIQNSKAQQGIFGGLLGGAGGILSDENAKTNIQPADDKIQAFLDAVGAHQYNYKSSVQGNPGTAPGSHVGPMAQELEKSELGKQMVVNTPQGKGVDFERGLGTIVAAQAALNKRLEALEGGKKMAGGGMVTPGYADGGMAMQPQIAPSPQPFSNPFQPSVAGGPQSGFGMFLAGMGKGVNEGNQQSVGGGDNPIQSGMSKLTEKIGDKYIKPMFQSTPAPMNAGQGPTLGNLQSQTPSIGGLGAEMAPAADGSFGTAAGVEGAEGAATAMEGAEGAAAAAEGAEAVEGLGSAGELIAALAKGGRVKAKVDARVSPGELWLAPDKVKQVAKGKNPIEAGERIPGKPKVAGNSYKNDVVSKKLDVGGIVIPNSIMQSKDPAKGAKDFVANIIAKRKARK